MSTILAERPRIFFCLTAHNSNQSLTRKGANFLPKFLSAQTNLLLKPESRRHPRPQQRGTKPEPERGHRFTPKAGKSRTASLLPPVGSKGDTILKLKERTLMKSSVEYTLVVNMNKNPLGTKG